jgi:hypothetical protein
MVQGVECLPSKCEALRSNSPPPSPKKRLASIFLNHSQNVKMSHLTLLPSPPVWKVPLPAPIPGKPLAAFQLGEAGDLVSLTFLINDSGYHMQGMAGTLQEDKRRVSQSCREKPWGLALPSMPAQVPHTPSTRDQNLLPFISLCGLKAFPDKQSF